MEIFLLKSSVSIVILYSLFYVIIRYESNHQLNRFIGWACLVFSIGLLSIPADSFFKSKIYAAKIHTVMQGTFDIQQSLTQAVSSDSMSIYFMIYIVGVVVFSLRSLIGFATLIYYCFSSTKHHRWGFKVVAIDRNVSPFTFFNILFIGNQSLEDKGLDAMLVHEQVHRDQLHSIDTLILEVLTVAFWFNPAIWFFQRDIKAEHEYIADEQVLKKGINVLEYQRLLFRAGTGVSLQLGNYLSKKTSLIKRFKKMKTQKINPKVTYGRALLFLPLMIMILVISSFSGMYRGIQPDTPAVYEKGESVMYKTVGDILRYPSKARKENRSGLVHVSFTVNKNGIIENLIAEKKEGSLLEEIVVIGYSQSSEDPKGVSNELKSEAIRAVKTLGKFVPAQKDGKPISSVLILPIQFKIQQ